MSQIALTIAGSDSGGGAGIQADLKTFTALQTYGTSVITCVTSQNTLTVDGIHPLPAAFVKQQLLAVLSDIGTTTIKTGMLLNREIIDVVCDTLHEFYKTDPLPKMVVDPVMVATSGSLLLESEAVDCIRDKLLPMAYILTPNISEAKVLAKWDAEIDSISAMEELCRALSTLGPRIILLKGGHAPFDSLGNAISVKNIQDCDINSKYFVTDMVYIKDSNQLFHIKNNYVKTKNTHGTGCTLSAAIAAKLALGLTASESIIQAISYTHGAILNSFSIGKGSGPLNHYHNFAPSLIPIANHMNPYPFCSMLINSNNLRWDEFVNHSFVKGIQDGTLPTKQFQYYIKQDYHFLLHYARANGLGAYKSNRIEESAEFAEIVNDIFKETLLHVEYCKEWGVSREELLKTEESMECVAYTRYVIDKAHSGELIDLRVAIAPCLFGYGQIGHTLLNDPSTKKEGNPYWKWILTYGGEEFQQTVHKAKGIHYQV
ncbi:Phosphomethylpyrimidine kinase-domain-containing protein [Globomyces pollinis-pini]|nr:Phosphomethylpyrimidine kinase-domain-containing protein [Globomyces pollinis-pini]